MTWHEDVLPFVIGIIVGAVGMLILAILIVMIGK